MGYKIAELRLGQEQEAVAFAKELGCDIPLQRINHAISLLAREDETIIGVALSCEIDPKTHSLDLYVGFDEKQGDMAIARALVDKALQKIRSRGAHRCHIIPIGPADTPRFWQQVNWLDQTLNEDAA